MSKWAYYSENDRQKAAWIRELIKQKLVTDGEVDERSIEDVLPADLVGFRRCHFFAGVAIWDYALNCAGYDRWDITTYTASCPCQPFSTAGKGKGIADERHLWPAFYHIASIRKPDVIFGEQVASKDGLAWLDTVQSDMEAMAYAFGPVVVPTAGVGAPHIRHRVFFVADSQSERCGKAWERSGRPSQRLSDSGEFSALVIAPESGDRRDTGETTREKCETFGSGEDEGDWDRKLINTSQSGIMDYPSGARLQGHAGNGNHGNRPGRLGAITTGSTTEAGPVNGFWRDAEWVYCRPEPRYPEGSYRAVRPGSFPLVDGAPARVVRLRGYGDGINAEVAKEFIKAYLDCVD